jgi:hypothetical protein
MVVRGGTAILPVPGKPSCFSYYDIGRLLWASIFGMGFLERWAIIIHGPSKEQEANKLVAACFYFFALFHKVGCVQFVCRRRRGGMAMAEGNSTAVILPDARLLDELMMARHARLPLTHTTGDCLSSSDQQRGPAIDPYANRIRTGGLPVRRRVRTC